MKILQSGLVALALLVACSSASAQDAYFVNTPKNDVTVTGSATLVAAENTFRVALSCTNNDASIPVRWGDSTVTTTTGQRVPADRSIEIKSKGAIYMISEDTDVVVSCTEEAR